MKKKGVREPDEKKIASLVRQLLVELGEDPGRDGLLGLSCNLLKIYLQPNSLRDIIFMTLYFLP